VTNENLHFFQATSKENVNTDKSTKLATIPIASIMKAEIVDLRSGRKLRRMSTKIANKFMFQLANAASSTTIHAKVFSATACKLIIYYLNEDGILMPAVFKIPSNSRYGKSAMNSLKQVRNQIKFFDKMGLLNWSIMSLDDDHADHLYDEDDIEDTEIDDSEEFGFDDVSAFLGDTKKIIKYLNFLAPSDSAVASAKLTAEMVAALTQKEDFKLTISTNQAAT